MNQSHKTILIGDGGHARSILAIDSIIKIDGYSSPTKNPSLNIEYFGNDQDLLKTDHKIVLGLSYIGRKVALDLRKKIISQFNGFKFETIIAKSAIVKTNQIGQGTVVFEGAIINSGTVIGENCVINTGAIVEHDCIIGNNVQISPRTTILGGVNVGDNTFIGAGTVVRDGVSLGGDLIIPMCSVIVNDI